LLKEAACSKDIVEELILTEVLNFFPVKFLEFIFFVDHFFAGNSGKCDKNVSRNEIAHLFENRFQILVVCRDLWVLFFTAFLQEIVPLLGFVFEVALAVQNAEKFESVRAYVVFRCNALLGVFEGTREKDSH
jgi:hypothetical protein